MSEPLSDTTTLYSSDGTSKIYKLAITKEKSSIAGVTHIHDKGAKAGDEEIDQINDLTIVNLQGKNYAFFNRFHTADIFMASLQTGEVKGIWDFTELYNKQIKQYEEEANKNKISGDDQMMWHSDHNMNGITSMGGDKFLITGKNWSGAYKVTLNGIDNMLDQPVPVKDETKNAL